MFGNLIILMMVPIELTSFEILLIVPLLTPLINNIVWVNIVHLQVLVIVEKLAWMTSPQPFVIEV